MSKNVPIDRYPGLRPFEESERFMFFGRSMELEELSQAININDLFVIHGESGLGKSSLINAGLIPLLREKGFYPVLIRFKERNKPPLQQVLHELKKLLKDIGNDQALREENKLWIWVKLMNSAGLKPILIFDQFEEFSYFHAEERLVLVKELAALLSPRIPDYARDITPGPEPDPSFSWFTQPKVKLLFSLRSDRISILEDFSDLMPAMLRSRYQLKPILLEQVEQIVVMPAVMESFNSVRFASAPFQYQPALINDVIEVVKDKKRNTVETTQLQMICQEIEQLVKQRQEKGEKNICVTQADLPKEKLEDLVNDFYRKQLEKIHTNPEISPDEFIAVRVLIEKRLLVQKKRIPLAEGTVFMHFTDFFKEKNVTISDDKIRVVRDLLLSLRLIRDQTYGDSLFYELSHDTLIEPIYVEMTEREADERRAQIAEERRKQELEIFKQRKYIDEINKQKEIAENALKELEVANREQKKQTQIAQSALSELQTARTSEAKTRRRLSRIISGIVLAVFALIISYVIFLDSRNKKSNNLLARVYRNEGRNNYELGNHQLAYRFWKDALEKSSNEKLNAEIREDLKRDFSAFAGLQIHPSGDGSTVAVKLRDSTWYFWEMGENHAKLLKTYRHNDALYFFKNGRWYYTIDEERHVRIFSYADSNYRNFKNAFIDLDTVIAPACTDLGDFFMIQPGSGSPAIFSFKPGGKITTINAFMRKLRDSVTATNLVYRFPVVDAQFVICNFNFRSYYFDLYRDAVIPLPVFIDEERATRYGNLLVIRSDNNLQAFNLKTRVLKQLLPRYEFGRQGVIGVADNDRYILFVDYGDGYATAKRLYGIDLQTDKQFRVANNVGFISIYNGSPSIPLVINNSLYLYNCRNMLLRKAVDSVQDLAYYNFEKVAYTRNNIWVVADRATLATDTILGPVVFKSFDWPLLAFENKTTTAIYQCAAKKTVATFPVQESMMFSGTYAGQFAGFMTSRGLPNGLTLYLKYIDSSMRVNENLQKYFKPYLDNVMDINK